MSDLNPSAAWARRWVEACRDAVKALDEFAATYHRVMPDTVEDQEGDSATS